MSPFRQLLSYASDVEGLIDGDPDSRARLITAIEAGVKWLVALLQQYEAQAIGMALDNAATALRKTRFFTSAPR